MSGFILLRLPSGLCTLIDAADLARVQEHVWNTTRALPPCHRLNFYVQGRVGGRTVSLHRFLMDFPEGLTVDRENGDGLDNRRSTNLRALTRLENGRNQHSGPAPLSMNWLPRGVPIVALARQPLKVDQSWRQRRSAAR